MKTLKSQELEQIRKSNLLVNGRYSYSLPEQKILLSILSKVRKDDDGQARYKILVRDIIEATSEQARTYKKIEALLEGLQAKRIRIDNGESIRAFSFISEYEIFRSRGYIEVEFSSGMKEQLLDLLNRGHFTLYNLACVLSLPSVASIRLYEILKSVGWKAQPVAIDLDTLKWSLGLEEGAYSLYNDFKRYVLDKAQAHIKKHTDLCFKYTPIKAGRKVTGISFDIKTNKSWQPSLVSSLPPIEKPVKEAPIKLNKEQLDAHRKYATEVLLTLSRSGNKYAIAVLEERGAR